MLPREKTKPENDLSKLITLVYGPPKIGKTTFCAGGEKTLFLSTEPGTVGLSVYSIEIGTWEEFVESCKALLSDGSQFDTVIIDTFDRLYEICADYVCIQSKVKELGDLPYGAGFQKVKTMIINVLKKMKSFPQAVILTSHAREYEIKTRGRITYHKFSPAIPQSIHGPVFAFVDLLLYVQFQRNEDETIRRVLLSQGTDEFDAGDRTGLLPPSLPLEWETFRDCFKQTKSRNPRLQESRNVGRI